MRSAPWRWITGSPTPSELTRLRRVTEVLLDRVERSCCRTIVVGDVRPSMRLPFGVRSEGVRSWPRRRNRCRRRPALSDFCWISGPVPCAASAARLRRLTDDTLARRNGARPIHSPRRRSRSCVAQAVEVRVVSACRSRPCGRLPSGSARRPAGRDRAAMGFAPMACPATPARSRPELRAMVVVCCPARRASARLRLLLLRVVDPGSTHQQVLALDGLHRLRPSRRPWLQRRRRPAAAAASSISTPRPAETCSWMRDPAGR